MASDDALALLRSIDATLKQLLAATRGSKPKDIASDSDLDGQYGDPTVKAKDPRDWTGPPMKGRRFSQCSSEYLELLAARMDFFAEKAERENKMTNSGKPEAPYIRRDAARARGWAKRHRDGWKPRTDGNGHSSAGFADTSEWPGMSDGDREEVMTDGDISWS